MERENSGKYVQSVRHDDDNGDIQALYNQALVGCIPIAAVAVHLNVKS